MPASLTNVEYRLERDGYAIVDDVLAQLDIRELAASLGQPDNACAGTRNLLNQSWCKPIVSRLRANFRISDILGPDLVAIQCTHFDKTPEANWLVAIHQDLNVPVAQHVSHPDLGVWSEKEGQLFVQAPAELLGQLIAVRVHIDDCGNDDGPLRVVPGSHTHGRLSPSDASAYRDQNGEQSCEVKAGGAMVMRPLLLHASSKAHSPRHRRVLHFLFAPRLPGYGLQWQYFI